MAKPRVFVSSTFFDLKTVRANLDRFIKEQGYDPVLFEQGNIAWGKDEPLDEYCYREIESCDIIVAIIGGKFGSKATASEHSITQSEIKKAVEQHKQIYIFIDKTVQTEYHTYLANKAVSGFKPVSVDNVKIFEFIESIYSLKAGNPVFGFETSEDIVKFLKEQWAGLFQRLLASYAKREEIQMAQDLKESLSTVKSIMDNLKTNNTKLEETDSYDEVWLLHHPAFSEVKKLLKINYRVVFLDLEELKELMSARGFIFDEGIADFTDEYYDFDNKKTGNFIRVQANIFDANNKLKKIFNTDWDPDYIEINALPSASENSENFDF